MIRIFCLLTLMTLSLSANARKPAVEDFVGVETKYKQTTPKGTEVLFNFGNHIKLVNQNVTNSTEFTSPYVGLGVLGSFVLLPFLMWFGMTRTTSKLVTESELTLRSSLTVVPTVEEESHEEEEFKQAS